jgi:ABC-type uncharacterized transport system permease subunit
VTITVSHRVKIKGFIAFILATIFLFKNLINVKIMKKFEIINCRSDCSHTNHTNSLSDGDNLAAV